MISPSESSPALERLLQREDTWHPYGNLKALCNDHIIISPIRPWWWSLEFFMIVITFVFVYEHEKYTIGSIIAGLILSFVSLLACFRTTMTSPGVIKKPTFEEAVTNAKHALRRSSGKKGSTSNNGIKVVLEHGLEVQYYYCTMCYGYRPSYISSCHCSYCDCCIEHWDHHCPVVGVCVSDANCFAFNSMVILVPSMWLFYFWVSLYGVLKDQNDKSASASKTFITVVTGVITTLFVCCVVTIRSSVSKKPRRSEESNNHFST